MRRILESSIDFSKLGGLTEKDLKLETKKAVISEEGKKLTLELELNFVLPYEAVDKFRRTLLGQLRDIEDVEIRFTYRDLLQSREEALRFYIYHMITLVNGRFAHVTKTIYPERFLLEADKLIIYALGQLSVDVLNKEVAERFRELLKKDLDMDVSVVFENDSYSYRHVGKHLEEKEREVFEKHQERRWSPFRLQRQNRLRRCLLYLMQAAPQAELREQRRKNPSGVNAEEDMCLSREIS